MPQLVPFYFLNQLFFGFISGIILLYLISKYILPLILEFKLVRNFIIYLNN